MSGQGYDDHLAYGQYQDSSGGSQERGQTGDRGLLGDFYNNFRGRKPQGAQQNVTEQYQPQLYGQQAPAQSQSSLYAPASNTERPPSSSQQASGGGAFSFDRFGQALHSIGSQVKQRLEGPGQQHSHTHSSGQCVEGSHDGHQLNRFSSFAPERQGNDAKWYVDACGYMWAVSRAIEEARESIWILDWWLSPELYLRRPPSKNEQYRVDRMLQAAAQRGVQVKIIVYKEVTQALTRKLRPSLVPYLHSLMPQSSDKFTPILTRFGLDAIFHSLEYVERTDPLIEPPIAVSSWHTKHALEALHPNIKVFRHPDHLPDTAVVNSSFLHNLQNMKLTAATAASLPADALKALYGASSETVLYWAHHEKLCLIDDKIAFMGGIDLCYGRWDTNQHSIADVHPGDLNNIVFPGQDYNNARVMDFQDVEHWQNNKLDRTKNSRMGWSDLSISLQGPVVADYAEHFAQRWNFIWAEKYGVKDKRYTPIDYKRPAGLVPASYPPMTGKGATAGQGQSGLPPAAPLYQPQQTQSTGQYPQQAQATAQTGSQGYPPPPPVPQGYQYTPQPGMQPPSGQGNGPSQGTNYFPPPPTSASRGVNEPQYGERGIGNEYSQEGDRSLFSTGGMGGFRDQLKQKAQAGLSQFDSRYGQKVQGGIGQLDSKFGTHVGDYAGQYIGEQDNYAATKPRERMSCQATRSCSKWSHGVAIEHSIANAYIDTIRNARHFVYIENQFFITANSDLQKPVKNRIGAALVDRILRAARSRQKFKVVVLMPSVPAFAGDLRSDEALSTRAIMEFQYDSISRGGHSIYQQIAREGYNPLDYIRFYNLRSYDRINVSAVMTKVEQKTGVAYEDARKQHDDIYGGGFATDGARGIGDTGSGYQAYHPDQTGAPPVGTNTTTYPPYNASSQQSTASATGYDSQYSTDQAYHGPDTAASGYNQQQQQPHAMQSNAPIELPGDATYHNTPQQGYTQPQQQQGYGSFAPPPPLPASASGYGERPQYPANDPYHQYQEAAQNIADHKGLGSSGRWDSVAECYMLNGNDIREVPWENGESDEMEAFVSEELYIHSKILIADDRICIIGSANLNDRSQLGDHDSEIACIIEDSATIESSMDGKPFLVGRFAASLRRFLFRRHLGLVPPQDPSRPDANFEPVSVSPNSYDWGSDEDRQVADPLDDRFQNMWNTIAHTNTLAFGKVFHPVPFDGVRNWRDYEEYYEKYFRLPESKDVKEGKKARGLYTTGHVVREEFPPGQEGILKMKEELAKIRGTLVEMPLVFLKEEDIAKEGLGLNAFTEEVYT